MNIHHELFNVVRKLRWQHLSPVVSTFSTSIRLLSSFPVLPPSDHYSIEAVSPSGDHYCIDIVVPPSSDHYGTTKVAPHSDHLHTNIA